MNYAEYLWNRNRRSKNNECIDDGEQALGWGDLLQNVRGTAGWLKAQGVVPYDRVLLQMEDCTELPVLFLACQWIGAVPVMAHPDQELPDDLPPIKLKVTDPDQFEVQDPVNIPFMKPTNECAVKFISSGTKGKSRIISWSIFAMCFTANKMYWHGLIDDNPRVLSMPRMSWGFGLGASLRDSFYWGGYTRLIRGVPTVERIIQHIQEFKPTHFYVIPTVLQKLLERADRNLFTRTQWIVSSGETLSKELSQEFHAKFGRRVYDGLGAQELGGFYCMQQPENYEYGTVGKPFDQVRIKLSKDGEMLVSTPARAYGEPEWYRTGDIAEITDLGNYRILGRKDTKIKVNSKWTYPEEVETIIKNIDTVEDVRVYKKGTELIADIIAPQDQDTKNLIRSQLPQEAKSIKFNYVDHVRNHNGKVIR